MSDSITPPNPTTRSSTPPPLPKETQRPADLHLTILTALIHPNTAEVVKQVNDFFLSHWPFPTEKHRKRFVDEGLAYSVCLTCPLSSDERMHWGCRLLTIGFLIDDLLDRMSLDDGLAHNMKVIECARGTLPDRDVPAQYIMYDIFEGLRKVDLQLVDAVLRPTIDLLSAQVDSTRLKPMDLKEYFVYRIADLGKG
jgi:aristolochene synthase